MIKNSIYKNYLVIIFLGFSNNIFSRNYCPDCCDCCKEKGEEESEEEIILKKNNFKYNWDISKYKANIEDNLEEEINKLNTESNAFKYLKIAEAIDVYNDVTNNKILRDNNLRNKIDQYKTLNIDDELLKKYVDDKDYNNNNNMGCKYDFEGIMDLFKESLENNKQLIPTENFFKYFYHPEYLGTNFNLGEKPISEYLVNNSKNFGYINLSKEEAKKDNLEGHYNDGNNILFNYFEEHYNSFTNFYKLKLHQIYRWLDDNQGNANLNDPDNIYSILDIIAKQRSGLCKNEAENIISSMYSTIISFINKNIKIDDIEIFTYSILSDFRQTVAKDVVNTMISQPDNNNYIKDEKKATHIQENADVIKLFLNSFLNSNISYTQGFSFLYFFDKAVEQANKFLKDFFNFGRLFEIILQYTKQAQANGSINNFIEEIEKFEVIYSDICAITEIPEVKEQIARKIKVLKIETIDNEFSKKSFEERLYLYLEKDNNEDLRNWKNNNSQKPLKELIEICKNYFDEGNFGCYFYLPELTEFYFNKDLDNIINYFTYILFPLYLLKEGYIKIKS